MEYIDKKLQGFQLIAQEKLQAIICSIPGTKDLILDPILIKPLERICSASWLKLKGIQRIYKFDAGISIPQYADGVHIYMIRSQMDIFTNVLQQVHEHEKKQSTDTSGAIKNFHIICVPSCLSYFQTILEEEGLYGLVQLHRYNWDFIFLDSGLLSMEVSNVLSSVFFKEDTSLLPSIASALRTFQMSCGRPDIILSYGDHSSSIIKMLNAIGNWPQSHAKDSDSDFAAMLIIDRDKDFVSSLLTPAIYSGLLLEVFNNRTGEIDIGLNSNKILEQKLRLFMIDKKSTDVSSGKDKKTSSKLIIRLNSVADEIYGENRYKHFSKASSLVRSQAKAIGLEVQKLNDMKIDEMHDYVARKLPKITELKTKILRHLNASEKVIEMLAENFQKVQSLEEDILNNTSRKKILQEIEELLTTDAQQYNTLRLICLLHLSVSISSEELSEFIRNYCNYFGMENLTIFAQLSNAGLLPVLEEEKPLNKSVKLLSNLPIPKFQQTEYQANVNRLKLLVSSSFENIKDDVTTDSTSNASRTDIKNFCPSYVFNSLYIPLISQLCSLLLNASSAEDLATKLGTVDKLQVHIANSSDLTNTYTMKSFANAVKESEIKNVFPLKKRNIFVFVVGGVTYSEIGACDLIGRMTGSQIIVASDSIISGADVMAAAF